MSTKTNEEYTGELAERLCDGVRDLERAVWFRAVPAPELYRILGTLKWSTGDNLAQLLGDLCEGLAESLSTHVVVDSDREPTESIDMARGHLDAAAHLANQIWDHLDKAQSAIGDRRSGIPRPAR